MKNITWSIVLMCLVPLACLSQAQTIVTGTIGGATSGYVEFRLQPRGGSVLFFVQGTQVIAPQTQRCAINSSGAIVGPSGSGNCLVWPTTAISPANTTYTVAIAPANNVTNTVPNLCIKSASWSLSSPTFCPVITLVPQFNTITTPPIQANLTSSADKAFNIGTANTYYAAAYIDQLFTNNLNMPLATITAGLFVPPITSNMSANGQSLYLGQRFSDPVHLALANMTGYFLNYKRADGSTQFAVNEDGYLSLHWANQPAATVGYVKLQTEEVSGDLLATTGTAAQKPSLVYNLTHPQLFTYHTKGNWENALGYAAINFTGNGTGIETPTESYARLNLWISGVASNFRCRVTENTKNANTLVELHNNGAILTDPNFGVVRLTIPGGAGVGTTYDTGTLNSNIVWDNQNYIALDTTASSSGVIGLICQTTF